jgi:TRAP-type C4-dicarboxylate transport system permease small subunit
MRNIHSIPFTALLLICGFALLVGWGRWHGVTRGGTPLSKKARWLIFAALLAAFVLLATLNAIQNHHFGQPQL